MDFIITTATLLQAVVTAAVFLVLLPKPVSIRYAGSSALWAISVGATMESSILSTVMMVVYLSLHEGVYQVFSHAAKVTKL